jgi:rhodanese-related sulfurtransferase
MLKELGYTRVAHLDGGLKAWREAGLTVETEVAPM